MTESPKFPRLRGRGYGADITFHRTYF